MCFDRVLYSDCLCLHYTVWYCRDHIINTRAQTSSTACPNFETKSDPTSRPPCADYQQCKDKQVYKFEEERMIVDLPVRKKEEVVVTDKKADAISTGEYDNSLKGIRRGASDYFSARYNLAAIDDDCRDENGYLYCEYHEIDDEEVEESSLLFKTSGERLGSSSTPHPDARSFGGLDGGGGGTSGMGVTGGGTRKRGRESDDEDGSGNCGYKENGNSRGGKKLQLGFGALENSS